MGRPCGQFGRRQECFQIFDRKEMFSWFRSGWQDNIRTDLKAICVNTRNLVNSVQDSVYWRVLVKAILNLRSLQFGPHFPMKGRVLQKKPSSIINNNWKKIRWCHFSFINVAKLYFGYNELATIGDQKRMQIDQSTDISREIF